MPWVSGYTRRDGTEVRSYWRSAPGAKDALAALAVVAVLVVGSGHGAASANGGSGKPVGRTVPARFSQPQQQSGTQPAGTPLIRITWPTPEPSYPIVWSTPGGGR